MNDNEITRMSHQIVTDVRAHLGYQGTNEERIGAAGTVRAWLYKLLEEVNGCVQPAEDERVERLLAEVRQDIAETSPNSSPMGVFRQHCEDLLRVIDGLLPVQPAQDERNQLLRRCLPYVLSAAEGQRMMDGFEPQQHEEDRLAALIVNAIGDKALRPLVYQPAASTPTDGYCEWEDNGKGFWLASCGDVYKVYNNDVNATGMRFCPFCGKSIKPIEFNPLSDGPRQIPAAASTEAQNDE